MWVCEHGCVWTWVCMDMRVYVDGVCVDMDVCEHRCVWTWVCVNV